MVAIKKPDADTFAARPDPARPIVLIYGPDAGLVRERAEKIIGASVNDVNDPFALVRLEGDELASTPSRLAEEAHTVPLFGGKRAIWIKAGSRNFAPAVEMVLATPPADCRIVIEAGDLRKSSPLRTCCEKAKIAAAIPCYADDERDLVRLIDTEMREAKLTITADARAALISLIGSDRQASRSEIRKLTLYAHGQKQIDLDDVLTVVADASGLALDAVVDAAFAGRTGETEAQLAKAAEAGTSAGAVVSAALRHVAQLHKARIAVDAGERADMALNNFVPPMHFSRRSKVEAAVSAWSAPKLARAMEQLAEAALSIRRTPALADSLGQRAVLQVATTARRNGR
jgi:DNA polymerase-3 subunit delta